MKRLLNLKARARMWRLALRRAFDAQGDWQSRATWWEWYEREKKVVLFGARYSRPFAQG